MSPWRREAERFVADPPARGKIELQPRPPVKSHEFLAGADESRQGIPGGLANLLRVAQEGNLIAPEVKVDRRLVEAPNVIERSPAGSGFDLSREGSGALHSIDGGSPEDARRPEKENPAEEQRRERDPSPARGQRRRRDARDSEQ